MDSTIISRGGDEMEIEEKKEDVKPEKKAKSYGKARKGIYFGSGLGFEGTEAYKLLRTNLKFAIPADKECKVIGVTSSLRGEGKSTTATNLAYMVAEDGARVLLIEADMRLPGIVSKLRLEKRQGLSNLLAGLCDSADAIIPPAGDCKFSVVQAGAVPPNPSELLGSDAMKKYLELWKNQFDYIIFDFPPVGVVSDALVLAELLDGMIVVVRQDYCEQPVLDDTVRKLKYVGANVLGFAVTMTGRGGKRYGKYEYGYGYGYGTDKASKKTKKKA